jgi:GNAT superfamily N-acetyltransferase
MIRAAISSDRLSIVRMMRDAHAAAPSMPVPFSAPHAHAIACRHDSTPGLLSLVYAPTDRPLGVLLASAQPHPFGPVNYAMETVWWIAPQARGRAANAMLDAYEAWAKEQRCAFCQMAALVSFPRAERIYLRRGYVPIETHYLKTLALAA